MTIKSISAEQSALLEQFIDNHREYDTFEGMYEDEAILNLQEYYDPLFKKADKKITKIKAIKHRQLWTDLKGIILDPNSYKESNALDTRGKQSVTHLLDWIEVTTWIDWERISFIYSIIIGHFDVGIPASEHPPLLYLKPDSRNLIAGLCCLSNKYFERSVPV